MSDKNIESYFFNSLKTGDTYDRVYNAQDFTNYLNLLVGNGVFPNPSTHLQVTAGIGMNIIVKAGSGWINGHKMINMMDTTLAIDTSDVILNRIDSVVFYVDYQNRQMDIRVKQGNDAVNPVSPPIIRDNNVYEMQLATVRVDKQTNAVTQAMITDTRGFSDVCGWVQGLVQQASTQTLFSQWTDAYNRSIEKNQNDFNAWFADVKENLKKAIPVRQYTSSYKTVTSNQTIIPINIEQYAANIDILNVYINGMKLIYDADYTKANTQITLKKPLDVIGTQIEFEVLRSVDKTV